MWAALSGAGTAVRSRKPVLLIGGTGLRWRAIRRRLGRKRSHDDATATDGQNAGWSFGTNAGGSTCSSGGACWVIVDANGLVNPGGVRATRPMLLSEWSKARSPTRISSKLINLDLRGHYALTAPSISERHSPRRPTCGGRTAAQDLCRLVRAGMGLLGVQWLGHHCGPRRRADVRAPQPAVGLFGVNSGVIRNVNLTDVSVTANPNIVATIDGRHGPEVTLRMITGLSDGFIRNVSASGQVNGTNVGAASVGGLVGSSIISPSTTSMVRRQAWSASIKNGSADVNVTVGGHPFCVEGLCVNVTNFAGGLVGFNYGQITGSSATGNVSSISTSSGAIVGGLVGANTVGIISELICFRLGRASARLRIGGWRAGRSQSNPSAQSAGPMRRAR